MKKSLQWIASASFAFGFVAVHKNYEDIFVNFGNYFGGLIDIL